MAKNWSAVTPDGKIHKLSYLDLLNELQDMIDGDAIYEYEREDINETLASFREKLWRYSY